MQTTVKTEPTFFKPITRLLDNIGLAMYSSVPKAVSELVANSYDADATKVSITIPEEFFPDSKIIISDDGVGMNRQQIDDEYMVLGYDKRVKSKRTAKGRLLVGNKGIGKLAGLGIAEIMEIETSKNGITCRFVIDKQVLDDTHQAISQIPIPVEEEATGKPNGTIIILQKILPRAKAISADELLGFVTNQFGLKPDFQITVNNLVQSLLSYKGEEFVINDEIEGCGQVTGKFIITPRGVQATPPGFLIRVRGRAVLGPTVFGVLTSGHRAVFSTGRIIGELNADFLDPEIPESKHDEFTITTSRDNFNESDPKFLKFKAYVEEKIRYLVKEIEAQNTLERTKRVTEDENFKSYLSRLPPHVQEKVQELINTIIPKLENLSDNEADAVIEIILKVSESSEFLEILKKMKAAASEDISRLANLLQDWGLYEITAITDLLKRRLAVIDQFDKLANDIATLEYEDIHKTLESNLWLLDDLYRLYASNKTLKKVIEGKIDQKFKRHENDRPDLICKDLMNRVVIIELKRPSHEIDSNDWSQLLQYKTFVKQHSPGYIDIDCYLVGRSYDESVREPSLQKSGYYLFSYSEIVTGARRKYKEILDIVENEREELKAKTN